MYEPCFFCDGCVGGLLKFREINDAFLNVIWRDKVSINVYVHTLCCSHVTHLYAWPVLLTREFSGKLPSVHVYLANSP